MNDFPQAAIVQLPDDRKPIRLKALLGLVIAGRRRAIEKRHLVRAVLDPIAQYINGAALIDLALQPRQKLAPHRALFVETERIGNRGLGMFQKGGQLHQIRAVIAVIVPGVPTDPAGAVVRRPMSYRVRSGRIAGMAGQRRANQAFEAALGGVRGHVGPRLINKRGKNLGGIKKEKVP